MKKLTFTATLLIAFILIPSLAFSDGNKDERINIRSTSTEIKIVPSIRVENPQFMIENDGTNPVPINTIDDGWGNSDQIATEFRECG